MRRKPTTEFAVVEVTVKVSYAVRGDATADDVKRLTDSISRQLDAGPPFGVTASNAIVTSRRRPLHV